MASLSEELLTRLIPLTPMEASYARNRLSSERPPWPKVGDQVYYRRNEWDLDHEVFLMRVVDVQDPKDTTSEFAHNLYQHLRSPMGVPQFFLDGSPVVVPLPDPWPWVKMLWEGDPPKTHDEAWKGGIPMTFESRMRGSAGWLPFNYRETRVVHLPGAIPEVPMATYRFNGEALEVSEEDGLWQPFHLK